MTDLFAMLGAGLHFLVYFVLAYVLVLAVVIFIHELGHFLVGRAFGIRVMSFSLGFGPEIAGFTDRRGTRWKLGAVPLGGYVKFIRRCGWFEPARLPADRPDGGGEARQLPLPSRLAARAGGCRRPCGELHPGDCRVCRHVPDRGGAPMWCPWSIRPWNPPARSKRAFSRMTASCPSMGGRYARSPSSFRSCR